MSSQPIEHSSSAGAYSNSRRRSYQPSPGSQPRFPEPPVSLVSWTSLSDGLIRHIPLDAPGHHQWQSPNSTFLRFSPSSLGLDRRTDELSPHRDDAQSWSIFDTSPVPTRIRSGLSPAPAGCHFHLLSSWTKREQDLGPFGVIAV